MKKYLGIVAVLSLAAVGCEPATPTPSNTAAPPAATAPSDATATPADTNTPADATATPSDTAAPPADPTK